MRKELLLAAMLLLNGCGTINTLVRGDEHSRHELRELNTRCDAIPRVYSGVAYDFCSLHAQPASNADQSGRMLAGVLIDGALSAVLDTLALPYTVYRQATDGNLIIPSGWKPAQNAGQ